MSDMPVDPVTSAEGGELGHAPSGEVRQDQPFAPPPPEAGAVDARPTPSEPPPAQVPPAPTTHVARVTRVTAEQVFVDVSGRQGTVPMIEFVGQPLPKEGDEFSVIIESEDAATGLLALSKRQAEEQTFWDSVKPGDILEGVVTGMNKGGLDIDIGGARAFLPASQVDTHRMRDISTLIGEHVRCVVSQVDRTTRDLIVSRRKLIDRDRKTKRAEMLRTLEEGELRVGTVSNITEYGAFVDLGGVDGLLHVTDMSWGRVKNPTEIVQMGQELQVRVLKVDRQAGKVSLGLKQIAPDPWEGAALKYAEGSRIRAAVARLADFGAFLELEPGIDALLPLSEMSWSRRIGSVSERVKIGDELEVVILKVDPARKRISVGLKQTEENPWASVETRFPVDAMVRGKVARVMEYGAFVELAPGLEGLVHISELSSQRVRQVGDVLQEGQEIEVRVLKVDLQAQRISLSMKPKIEMSARAESPASKKPARKRPLRGGLSSHFDW